MRESLEGQTEKHRTIINGDRLKAGGSLGFSINYIEAGSDVNYGSGFPALSSQ